MNDQDFAVVVGINGYPQLTPLRGAHQDANSFKNWLLSPDGGGLPEENVRLILSDDKPVGDPFDAHPIKRTIDKALRDFGIGNINLTDLPIASLGRRLYFYFSGHGVGPNFDEVAMLMADAGPNFLNNNLGMRPYRSLLHQAALFKECVFIIDCCRDPVSGITPAAPAFTLPAEFGFGPCHPVQDFVVMAADWGSKAFERPISVEEEEGRLGVLTSHLIAGLSNPAAADADGRITSETLRKYVFEKMSETQEKTGVSQIPNFIPPSRSEIVFKTFPVAQLPRVMVRILAPANLTGDLILRDGFFRELSRQPASKLTAADAPWQLSLERSQMYVIEHVANGESAGNVLPLDLRNAPPTHEFHFSNH